MPVPGCWGRVGRFMRHLERREGELGEWVGRWQCTHSRNFQHTRHPSLHPSQVPSLFSCPWPPPPVSQNRHKAVNMSRSAMHATHKAAAECVYMPQNVAQSPCRPCPPILVLIICPFHVKPPSKTKARKTKMSMLHGKKAKPYMLSVCNCLFFLCCRKMVKCF